MEISQGNKALKKTDSGVGYNGRFFVTLCVPEERRLAQFLQTTIPTNNYFLHAKTVTSKIWRSPEGGGTTTGAHKKQL